MNMSFEELKRTPLPEGAEFKLPVYAAPKLLLGGEEFLICGATKREITEYLENYKNAE